MSSVAKIITDTILAKMQEAEKSGTSFRWVKPWNSGLDRAYSYDTQIPYSGVNRLLLDNDEYLTFNKMQEINQQKGNAIYELEDKIHPDLRDDIGVTDALNLLYDIMILCLLLIKIACV